MHSELFLMDVEKLFFYFIFHIITFQKKNRERIHAYHHYILYINLCCVHWMTCIVKNFHQIYMQRVWETDKKIVQNSIKFAVELIIFFIDTLCTKKIASDMEMQFFSAQSTCLILFFFLCIKTKKKFLNFFHHFCLSVQQLKSSYTCRDSLFFWTCVCLSFDGFFKNLKFFLIDMQVKFLIDNLSWNCLNCVVN